MLTVAHVKWLAPRAKQEYVDCLTSEDAWAVLTHYGITATPQRLAGFLANVGHETGSLSIWKESLNYKSPSRLKAVWPSRFRNKSDAELQALCNNPAGLAEAVYGGRMGNRRGTDDALRFCGTGFLQTTGREDFIKLGKACGMDFEANPEYAESAPAMLRLAAAEWAHGCNELMDAGNFPGACAKINVGAASRVSAVIGMEERKRWYARCLQLLGANAEIMDLPAACADDYDDEEHGYCKDDADQDAEQDAEIAAEEAANA